MYAGKKKVLGEEEGKTNLGGKKSVETYCNCKNWFSLSLFIGRILWAYYLLYFFYKNELYFTLLLNK